MKNNIILILVVTVISIAVIIITIAVSAGKSSGESSSESSSVSTEEHEITIGSTTGTEPEETTEPDPVVIQSTQPTEQSSEPERVHDIQTAENIIATARSLMGIDFVDGGISPDQGFDNSGYIYYVLRENGYITCPRGVAAQSEMGASLAYDELKPGDLVFFSEGGETAEFGGIYAGEGVALACLMPGTKVKEIDITSNYYRNNFYCGVAIN